MKKRKDSFLGIHFDFHALPGQIVASDYRPQVIAELLDKVKPDFVQCDTKGHPGISSYPTKVGTMAECIKEDVLKTWRDLTAERGIALYGHHSGIFDCNAAKTHPDWAVKDENGNPSDSYMSVFGPYADELLIPQLKELALNYNLDGAWIDGECWAAVVDYSEHAVNAYRKEYDKEPPKSSEEGYEDYKEFCRKGFVKYVTHYITELKKVKPDFEITSNWIYSAYMPEKAEVKVDYLSGDYSSENAIESARHVSRCLAARNIPWDLMAWGQNAVPGTWTTTNRSTKEYEQYCQEAAMIIALGGGFQFFNIMYGGGGTVQPWAIPIWEKVAKFCREREFNHKSKSVHQIGIIYPFERIEKENKYLYSCNLECYRALRAWNNCMLDSGYSTEVIFESEIDELNEYPLVVLGRANKLNKKSIHLLEEYVENGGHLIVDLKSAKYFEKYAGLKSSDIVEKVIFVEGAGALAAVQCDFTTFDGKYDVSANVYLDNYFTDNKFPGGIIQQIGQGNITFMCMDFAAAYEKNKTTAICKFMEAVIQNTGYEPLVSISGSVYADLMIMEKEGNIYVNLVNTAGPASITNVRGYNEVPKIGPIKVRIKKDNIKRITEMPGNKILHFKTSEGYTEFEFETIHIHAAAIIEFR